uniref:Uncharacterized protein n=1 Tax=Arundo donax TaxID=35708 RepID=A0A0A9D6R1_ARUDO
MSPLLQLYNKVPHHKRSIFRTNYQLASPNSTQMLNISYFFPKQRFYLVKHNISRKRSKQDATKERKEKLRMLLGSYCPLVPFKIFATQALLTLIALQQDQKSKKK